MNTEDTTEDNQETTVEKPAPERRATMGESIGDDAASLVGLIKQLSKELAIKPEIGFRVAELVVNYRLAVAQINMANGPQLPFPTRTETEDSEETNGD